MQCRGDRGKVVAYQRAAADEATKSGQLPDEPEGVRVLHIANEQLVADGDDFTRDRALAHIFTAACITRMESRAKRFCSRRVIG